MSFSSANQTFKNYQAYKIKVQNLYTVSPSVKCIYDIYHHVTVKPTWKSAHDHKFKTETVPVQLKAILS